MVSDSNDDDHADCADGHLAGASLAYSSRPKVESFHPYRAAVFAALKEHDVLERHFDPVIRLEHHHDPTGTADLLEQCFPKGGNLLTYRGKEIFGVQPEPQPRSEHGGYTGHDHKPEQPSTAVS